MDFQQCFNQEIDSLCQKLNPNLSYVKEYLLIPGKQFRPHLYLDFIKLSRDLTSKDYQLAVGLEFLHLFFLVHDDIMDGDELRRDHKTIHFFYEEHFGKLKAQGLGIIIGDLLFSRSLELIMNNCDYASSAAIIFDVINKTAQGQLNEYLLYPSKFLEIKPENLLKFYEEKTALYSVFLPLALANIPEINYPKSIYKNFHVILE